MKSDDRFISVNPGRTIQRRSGARECANCHTSNPKTSTWRIGPNGETWCNKCGLRNGRRLKKTRQGSRPLPGGKTAPRNISASLSFPTHPLPWQGQPKDFDTISVVDSPNIIAHAASASSSETPSYDVFLLDTSDEARRALEMQEYGIIERPGIDYGQVSEADDRRIEIVDNSCGPSDQLDIISTSTQMPVSCEEPTYITSMDSMTFNTMPSQDAIDATPAPQPLIQFDQMTTVLFNLGLRPDLEYHLRSPDTTNSQLSLSQLQLPSLHGPSQQDTHLTTAEGPSVSELDSIASSGNIIHPSSHSGAVIRQYVRSPMSRHSDFSAYNAVAEFLSSQIPESHSDSTNEAMADQIQCKCLCCLRKFFSLYNTTVPEKLLYGPERWLHSFYLRAAAVHLAALQRRSSVYVATETFTYEHAGDNLAITAFAVLREQYDTVPSPCESTSVTAFTAARSDLFFDCVSVGVATYPSSLDDWLQGQLLMKHLTSERAKAAIWDLSRLPTGAHLSDSRTFRWLQRTLLPINTSSGPQNIFNVQSGSDQHQFRRFHHVQALIKYIKTPNRIEMFGFLEPVMQEACIRSCQEWFIAVLDEAAKRPNKESKIQFLDANKTYMEDSMVLYRLAFQTMNIDKPRHICSFNCPSHIQPTFDTVLQTAQDALQKLFGPPEKQLRDNREKLFTYPTQEQLFLTRVVGMALFKLYFSYALLDNEQRIQHSILTRQALVKARVELVERSKSKLIWNYLPVDVAQIASERLDRAARAFGSSPMMFQCQ